MRARLVLAVVTLAAGLVAVPGGASADFLFNGTIEGRVTLWGSGEPVEGAEVRGLYEYGFVSDVTDADGYYRLANLEPGNYSVAFLRGPGEPFVYHEWGFVITNDEVFTGVDGMVQDAGTMIGRVTDGATGLPVAGMCADVYDISDTVVGTAESNADGWLLYPDVTVSIDDRWLESAARVYDCNDLGHPELWYYNIVEYLSSRGRFEARIPTRGDIAGTVTFEHGGPISGICVSLWSGSTELDSHLTDSEGYYGFSQLVTGDYTLDFEDCNDEIAYRPVWDVPITVTTGEVTYYDQELEPASTISGTVTDASTGLPLQAICVLGTEEWFQDSRFWLDLTDAYGNYTLIVPPNSDHQYVRAYWCGDGPDPYAEQWWDGVTTFAEASDLHMDPLERRSGVDIAMPRMASLQGTLTGEDGLPAATSIWFEPRFDGANWVPRGTSDADGTYRIDNIEAGEYLIRFGSDYPGSLYAAEWFDGAAQPADATPVVFDWGEVKTIDAALDRIGAIEWDFVVDWEAFPTMCAYLTDAEGRTVAQASDRSERHFLLGGLAAGDYLLYAEDCSTGDPAVAPVWWPDGASREEALVLTVDGDNTDLGDWFLGGDIPGPSSVSGDVTRNGEPFDACVTVLDQNLAVLGETVAVAGEYTVEGILLHGPDAALYVTAADCEDTSAAAWHGGPTEADAVAIPYARGTAWSGVDIDLPGEAEPEFADTSQSVFQSDIQWLAGAGITKGCNPPVNDMFCPSDVVTRGQMAAFLVRALDLTERLDDPFVDDDGSIFEADIERLAAAGITKGCNPPVNDMFCPSDVVTRGQMAAFLVRALSYTDRGEGDLFDDDDGSVFEAAIDKLATAGVTRGCDPPMNDRFCPGQVVTRGQMAAFLHRALG